ncbi:MAG: GFA family protein [Rhodospirillaceae bacterium]|nr:GFA family protein [Rhodospirillaceae bacterium]MBT5779971.1 GFA family protein [Rhodospirillaceae bacterium]MBT7293435.1 GFA family protein [Rhodospirillaceae bacterium]
MSKRSGRCLCGSVSYEYSGPVNWSGHCHCESCRRNCSAAIVTFFGVPRSAYSFTGTEPDIFESSSGVRRLFCSRCGTPMAYDADRYPDEIHFYAASLIDPENFTPQFHVHCGEQLDWLKLADDLPKYEKNASSAVKNQD